MHLGKKIWFQQYQIMKCPFYCRLSGCKIKPALQASKGRVSRSLSWHHHSWGRRRERRLVVECNNLMGAKYLTLKFQKGIARCLWVIFRISTTLPPLKQQSIKSWSQDFGIEGILCQNNNAYLLFAQAHRVSIRQEDWFDTCMQVKLHSRHWGIDDKYSAYGVRCSHTHSCPYQK